MKLSLYFWAGYGLAIATIFGMDRYGFKDYRVMFLFIY